MNTLERFTKVYRKINQSTNDLEIIRDLDLSLDLGIDSLKKIQLGVFLEDEFKITLDAQFFSFKTVGQVIDCIDMRLK